jgi:hypothetical protein
LSTSSTARPEREAVTPESTSTADTSPLLVTASVFAPGPVMVRSWEMLMSVVRVMVVQGGDREKPTVSPGLALATS